MSITGQINEVDETKTQLIDLYGQELADFFNNTEFSPDGYREILINFSAKKYQKIHRR